MPSVQILRVNFIAADHDPFRTFPVAAGLIVDRPEFFGKQFEAILEVWAAPGESDNLALDRFGDQLSPTASREIDSTNEWASDFTPPCRLI